MRITVEPFVRRSHPSTGKVFTPLLERVVAGAIECDLRARGKRMMTTIRSSPAMNDRVRVLAGIDFRDVGPRWAQRAVAQLEADVAGGAVGIGEIPKNFATSRDKTMTDTTDTLWRPRNKSR